MQKDLGPAQPLGALPRAAATTWTRCSTRRSPGAAASPSRNGRTDILTLLLAARDEDGAPLTDRELRDELITLLLAGHETTATSIGWAFERLLRTPARARAADRRGEGGRRRRLHGGGHQGDAASAAGRDRGLPRAGRADRARRLPGGAGHPAGGLDLPGPVDPELYPPDPQEFRPERFLDGAPEPYTWIPFGGGVRRCLGAAFAQLEMKIVIAAILTRARLRAPRDSGARRRASAASRCCRAAAARRSSSASSNPAAGRIARRGRRRSP